MTSLTHSTIQLVNPTGRDPGERPFILTPRPVTLSGKRLGLLDNSKANAEVILKAIARILDEEAGKSRRELWSHASASPTGLTRILSEPTKQFLEIFYQHVC